MSVCHGCPKRKLHCHSACKEWDEEVERERARKEKIWQQRKAEKVVTDVLYRDCLLSQKAKKEISRRASGRKNGWR